MTKNEPILALWIEDLCSCEASGNICNIRSNENIHTCNKDIMIKLANNGTDNSAGYKSKISDLNNQLALIGYKEC